MALRAVAEDPLTSDDNLLIDDLQDNNSDESSMAKDTNCFMRETIMSLHWYVRFLLNRIISYIFVTIMCRNDELSWFLSLQIQNILSYLQKIAKSFSKFLLFPFS